MPKTATVQARIEEKKKKKSERILKKLGKTHSEAINVLYDIMILDESILTKLQDHLELEEATENLAKTIQEKFKGKHLPSLEEQFADLR